MNMKQIKVSEATGPALDWLVATCEGYTEYDPETDKLLPPRKEYGWVSLFDLNYSTDWSQGGPIIEKLRSESHHSFLVESDGANVHTLSWPSPHVFHRGYGPTLLIAAMRCRVVSKLGETAEVPEELV